MLNMTRDEHFPIDGAIDVFERDAGPEAHGRVGRHPRRDPARVDDPRDPVPGPHARSVARAVRRRRSRPSRNVSGGSYDPPVSLRVVTSPYGRAASEALRGEIARAKRESPLAPVTVVVPGNSVGVAVRRLLASGELGPVSPAGVGVIGVTFLTVYRLAELLGGAAAGRGRAAAGVDAGGRGGGPAGARDAIRADVRAGRRRIPRPRRRSSARTASSPISTTPRSTRLAAQSARAHEVVRIHRSSRSSSRAAWYDEHDLMRAARDVVGAGAPLLARARHGRVPPAAAGVAAGGAAAPRGRGAHRPRRDRGAHRRRPNADATWSPSVGAARRRARRRAAAGIRPPHGDRGVLGLRRRRRGARGRARRRRRDARGRAARAHGGRVRQHRAVRAPAARAPRARRDRAQRRVGADARRLGARAGPAAAARAPRRRLPPRRRVRAPRERAPCSTVTAAACRRSAWERVSRDAGVVGGVERVARAARRTTRRRCRRCRRRRRRRGSPGDRRRERRAGCAGSSPSWPPISRGAPAYVVGARAVGAPARRALDRRRRAARASWSPFEQEAARRVEAVVDRLGGLDAVEAAPDARGVPPVARARARRRARPRRPARRRRARRARRRWRSASSSTGCGCAGSPRGCSRRRRATIRCSPTATAARSRASCRCASDRIADDQRALLAALASTTGARVLCFPRGDLRRSTEHVPSRFLARHDRGAPGERPVRGKLPRGAVVHERAVVRARPHARGVPRDPARARRARRARRRGVGRGRARGRARRSSSRARAGARRSRASTATSRTSAIALAERQPGRAGRRGLGDAARDVGQVPARVLRAATCCTSSRSSGPRRSCSSRRSTGARRARGARPVPRRAAAACPASAGRGPAEHARACTRSCARRARTSRRAGSPAGACCGNATRRQLLAELDCFLDADGEYRAENGRRDDRDRARVRPARTPSTRRSRSRAPTGARVARRRLGRPRRPARRRRARRHRLQDRLAAAVHDADARRSGARRHAPAAPGVRVRGARALLGEPARRADRGVLLVRRRGHEAPHRLRGRRRGRGRVRRRGAHDRRRHRARAVRRATRRAGPAACSSSARTATPTAWAPPTATGEWERKGDAPELAGYLSSSSASTAEERDA